MKNGETTVPVTVRPLGPAAGAVADRFWLRVVDAFVRVQAFPSALLLSTVLVLPWWAMTVWLHPGADRVSPLEWVAAVGLALAVTLAVIYPLLRLLIALEHGRREAQWLAVVDGLTGLYNRRHFMSCADRLLGLSLRHRRPMCLMLLDIDHFKRINDDHGHQVGDRVLVDVTEACRRALRQTDVVARFGGEEFIVALPETDLAAASRLAERLQAEVACVNVAQHAVGGVSAPRADSGLTVSVGIAALHGAAVSLDHLVRLADEAMYAAKHAGRNRVHGVTA
jgi:diguanylate cyclase (GGDEF)-like protein